MEPPDGVTKEKLQTATNRYDNNKAPGSDEIPIGLYKRGNLEQSSQNESIVPRGIR